MKRYSVASFALIFVLVGATILPGCLESFGSNSAPNATFSVTTGTLKVGMQIEFDASASSDADGDTLTYSWNFGDTNTATEDKPSHSYSSQGDYVVTLSVSDGEFETQETQTLKIFPEDASEPIPEIATSKDDDCDDEAASASGTYILIWICDDAMDEGERDWDPSTTVTLDASESEAGSVESWLVSWKWDLNINIDSDGDGDKANDEDADGETYSWDTPPGEWKVKLTVTDDQGMTATEETWVYVNARAKWSDIEIGRNNTADNPREDFTVPFIYDFENSHKLNQFKARIVYPKKDPGMGCGQACEQNNRMDIYLFNDTDEEVRNSSANSDEQQTDSNCNSDDNYCLTTTSSTGDFRNFLDGTWTVQVFNTKQHNAEILEIQIILKYK
ncbi:MAG: PKD domain-containing protein [Euryarchaeota archaeon]|jgi:PKD repeat protein|nr:PKD domain-containing protein [Euryarchaeota archaeon]